MNEYDNKSEDEKAAALLAQVQKNQAKGEQNVKENRSNQAKRQMKADPNNFASQMDQALKESKADGSFNKQYKQQEFTFEDRNNSRNQFNDAFKPKRKD